MHRRALGLLLAASALPFTPAFAQDQPTGSDPPPIVDTAPPPVTTSPPETTAPAPVATTPPPVIAPAPIVTSPPPAIATPTVRSETPVRRTTRATTRTVTRQASPVRSTAPAAAVAAPAATAPLAAQPAPAAEPAPLPVETLPVETLPVDTATTTDQGRTSGLPLWAWLLAGLGVLAVAVALLTRRRRRVVEEDYVREEPTVYAEPVRAEAPADFGADYQAPIVAPAMAVAPLVAERDEGEPQIEFEMRPVRAGVGEDDARVEFELGVTNRGTGTARDVRVSAWMLGANSPTRSEAEDTLIERVDIDAGEDANVEASVGLPRSGLTEDAIIPVVVAEATYRRPDGSEGRTTATYQVGVPDGAEMIYFDVENPSGLHGGVVAREIDELERA